MGKVTSSYLREKKPDRTDPSGPHCMHMDFSLGFEEASAALCFRLYSMYLTVRKLLDQVMHSHEQEQPSRLHALVFLRFRVTFGLAYILRCVTVLKNCIVVQNKQ